MTWSVIEGTELTIGYKGTTEPGRVSGTVLCWDGQPVELPLRPLLNSWTTPWGARHHHCTIPFENGWIAELRFEEGAPSELSAGGTTIEHPERLTLAGENRRGRDEREKLEQADLVESHVGDEWDFSHEKTGYEYPGAYVQWYLFAVPNDDSDYDVEEVARLFEEGPWASVPDLTTLQSRLQIIAMQPSDPEEAARLARGEEEAST